jgi:hypothetical protein
MRKYGRILGNVGTLGLVQKEVRSVFFRQGFINDNCHRRITRDKMRRKEWRIKVALIKK